MTRPFRLGFMLRIPLWDEDGRYDPAALFADGLELAQAAEDLGFDSFWVTQHHFGSVDSPLPSPLVFLGAVAARTRRIRLGTTVITASLEHPVRLAEDASTLDVLSGGRVELGLGTSSSEIERAAFGVPPAEQRAVLHRTTLALVDAFSGRPVSGMPDAVLEPRTPSLAQRIWTATATTSNAVFAATHGFGLITNYRPADLPPENQGYLDAYRAHLPRDVAPRIAMSRGLFPCADKASARRILTSHAARFVERGRRFGWLPAGFGVDDYFARPDFHYGHPEEVAESLANDTGLGYATELLTGMLSARLTPRELRPVMERIAVRVAPALGWHPDTGSSG